MEKILNDLIDQYAPQIIATTQELIRIESVNAPGESPDQPFGKGTAQSLDYMLSLARDMGMKQKNLHGYVGYAELGTGEELIGVLSHLDVVPAGIGWDVPPFSGVIRDNRIYGRGAMDDKGPSVAALFALYAIKESGLPIHKRVRHIMGLNEEDGFGCIAYYLDHEEVPAMGFSPDGDFPVIHGEKGILQFRATTPYTEHSEADLCLRELWGGTAPNVVPGEAHATFTVSEAGRTLLHEAYAKLPNPQDFLLSEENDPCTAITITAKGKSCHGSRPDMGENAIGKLLAFLQTVHNPKQPLPMLCQKLTTLFLDGCYGAGAGVACSDEVSGRLTMNLGTLAIQNGTATCQVDVRYPITADFPTLWQELTAHAEAQAMTLEISEHKRPLYVPLNHPLVTKLCRVYQEMTGEAAKPLVIGGGTYCRALQNFVAFGPMFPHNEDTVHQANEYIAIADLITMSKIYAQAIYELIK